MNLLKTQIGGKFSSRNPGLYELKRHLVNLGIKVNYPIGDSIVQTINGIDLSFNPEISLSFYEVEINYLSSIRSSSFHTVYSAYGNVNGYVGKSAGMEISYAMLHHVPVVFSHYPSFQNSIDSIIRNLLFSRINLFRVIRFESTSDNDLTSMLENITNSRIDYKLSIEEEIAVMAYVRVVLDSYRML